jgi:Kef-type K+ transport system membrane component KefB
MTPDFLPQLPPQLSQPVLFGALLVLGLLAGEAVRRYAALPRIVGYVLAGVLLGPQATNLLSADALLESRLLIDLSLGLILFELGFRLDFAWLRRNPWLFATALAESLFCFAAIHLTLLWFGFQPLLAAAAAAIGTATSPAVVMVVAHELRAEGQVTERMLLFTAVNSLFAYLALTLLLPFLPDRASASWEDALVHPVYLVIGSVLAGLIASLLLLRLGAWIGQREEGQFVLLVGAVVLTVGVAHTLKLSVLLTLLTLGMLSRNLDRRHVLLPLRFGHGGQLFFVVLFVLTGASLEFASLGAAAGVAGALVAVRFAGKAVALLAFGRLSGIRAGGAGLLAIALLPMSGLAVVMVQDTALFYPSFGRELANVVLAAVVVLELAGPLATQFALRRAGEARPGD